MVVVVVAARLGGVGGGPGGRSGSSCGSGGSGSSMLVVAVGTLGCEALLLLATRVREHVLLVVQHVALRQLADADDAQVRGGRRARGRRLVGLGSVGATSSTLPVAVGGGELATRGGDRRRHRDLLLDLLARPGLDLHLVLLLLELVAVLLAQLLLDDLDLLLELLGLLLVLLDFFALLLALLALGLLELLAALLLVLLLEALLLLLAEDRVHVLLVGLVELLQLLGARGVDMVA